MTKSETERKIDQLNLQLYEIRAFKNELEGKEKETEEERERFVILLKEVNLCEN